MIPKIIHYCWFGMSPKPKLAKKCITSWRRVMPDYEVFEWNESNFQVDSNPYLIWCYDNKKWAFLSDLARLMIVEEHGGIYFDTDVEAIKRFDDLLENEAFFGFENEHYVATGLGFGTVAHHGSLKAMMSLYSALEPDENGGFHIIGCPILNTKALEQFGLVRDGKCQDIDRMRILSPEFLNPYDDPTGLLNITENTYSIHWYGKSWMSRKAILRSKLTQPIHRIFGVNSLKAFRKN